MAYTTNDYVGLITKYKDTNPGLAYAIFNGLSGMGGNGVVDPGAVDIALRNAWGDSEARNWIGTTDNTYGGAMFDPESGKYGYYQNGQIQSGTLEGWTPANYDKTLQWTGAVNYNPVTTFPGAGDGRPGTGGGTGVTPQPVQGQNPRTTQPVTTTPVTTNPGTTTPVTTNPGSSQTTTKNPNGTQATTLEQRAKQILGSYMLYKADGTPDWERMSSTTDFYNSLPDAIKLQVTAASLGAAMRTEAGLALLPGMNLPDWYASAGAGVDNGVYNPPTYNAPVYKQPDAWVDPTGDIMDYFDDEGYKFRLAQGQDAIATNRAAQGTSLSGKALKEAMTYAEGLASEEFANATERRNQERNFSRGVYQDDRDTGRSNFESDRDFGRDTYEDERNFGYTNYKDLRDFIESARRFGLNFDRDTEVSDRDYNENQRRWDLTFDRDTATGDRTFEWGTLKDLAQLGLSGSQGNSQLAAALAALLSNNTIAGGNAQAGGTVGSANSINNLISTILQQIMGNKIVDTATGTKP